VITANCSVYVDLNPIRAGIAETPETSTFTSAYERIQTLAETATTVTDGAPVSQVGTGEDGRVHGQRVGRATPSEAGEVRAPRDGWLSPVELQGDGAAESRPAERRASNKGFLPLKLDQYLELLDWTGRQTRPDKRGQIPAGVVADPAAAAAVDRDLGRDGAELRPLVSRGGGASGQSGSGSRASRPSVVAGREPQSCGVCVASGVAEFVLAAAGPCSRGTPAAVAASRFRQSGDKALHSKTGYLPDRSTRTRQPDGSVSRVMLTSKKRFRTWMCVRECEDSGKVRNAPPPVP